MPQKCGKVKNPCKICLAGVSNKNGLQCKGACKKWVHFSCLHYTPGKIKDIKAGIIKVTCPCPDCKTTMPKEYRTDAPFSCTNVNCPSNMPRSCTNSACPSNQKMNQTSDHRPPPFLLCEKGVCQKHTSARPPPPDPCIGPCPDPILPSPDQNMSPTYSPGQSPVSSGIKLAQAPSPREGMGNALEQMCNTVGQLTNQINRLMNEMKNATEAAGGKGGGYGQAGPQSNCPKPCFCPKNPRNKF